MSAHFHRALEMKLHLRCLNIGAVQFGIFGRGYDFEFP